MLEHGFAGELTHLNTGSGLQAPLPRTIQWTIEALTDFTKDLRKNKRDWKNVESYSYKGFSAFRMTCAIFEHWLVGFKAKLKAYDVDTKMFLNETWPPAALQGFTRDLFVKQCAFFWVLMLEVFKSYLSSSCVHSHSITRNGRQAYFDFVNLHSESKAKVYNNSTQLQALLKLNLDKWKESKVKFITNWFKELNHFNKLRPPNKPLEYDTVKSALCQACYSSFQLSKQFSKINDPGGSNSSVTDIQAEAATIHKLKITLLLEATRLNSQSAMSAPKSTIGDKEEVIDGLNRGEVNDEKRMVGQCLFDIADGITMERNWEIPNHLEAEGWLIVWYGLCL
eukprot:jgi/Psemu1/48336/gm1.48336_g